MKDKYKTIFIFECIIAIIFLSLGRMQINIDKIVGQCYLFENYGLYCTGCGGTRAVRAFFKGKLITCIRYHPFVAYFGILYGISMLSYILNRFTKNKIHVFELKPIYGYISIAIIIVQCIIKNILLIFFCYRII